MCRTEAASGKTCLSFYFSDFLYFVCLEKMTPCLKAKKHTTMINIIQFNSPECKNILTQPWMFPAFTYFLLPLKQNAKDPITLSLRGVGGEGKLSDRLKIKSIK